MLKRDYIVLAEIRNQDEYEDTLQATASFGRLHCIQRNSFAGPGQGLQSYVQGKKVP